MDFKRRREPALTYTPSCDGTDDTISHDLTLVGRFECQKVRVDKSGRSNMLPKYYTDTFHSGSTFSFPPKL